MDCVQIPCPRCGAELRLQDRALLGRRGRCPSCAHRFILREPEDVELELAEPVPQLPLGTSAQWVPDDPPAPAPNGRPAAPASSADVYFQAAPNDGGFISTTGQAVPPFPVAQSSGPDGHQGAVFPQSFPVHADPAPSPIVQTAAPPVTGVVPADKSSSGVDRLKLIRRRNAKRRRVSMVVGGIVAAMLAGVLLYAKGLHSEPNGNRETQPGPPLERPPAVANGNQPTEQPAADETPQPQLAAPAEVDSSPTNGPPLDLRWMPVGPRVIVHLKTGELWGGDPRMQEIRNCLGPFGQWIDERLREVCLFGPAELEQATIGFVLGARGTPPDVAAVVRLKAPIPRSELIQTLRGTRMDDLGYPYYVVGQRLDDQRAYLIDDDDPQKIAVGPEHLVKEMIEHQNTPPVTSNGIEQLLLQTDRDRHATVVFEPNDLRLHRETIAAENVHLAWDNFLDFFGDSAEAVAWSLHMGNDGLYSEFRVRPDRVVRPQSMQQELQARLNAMPTDVLAAVEMMRPATAGGRQLIGRFPAMMQAARMGTHITVNDEFVQIVTSLPSDRPAPNLLLAGRLTWEESTRTDFSAQKATTQPAGVKPVGTIADRLNKQIDVDFNRTPLQEAFDYIGEETNVRFEIDGDALKLAGYTKNMAQTFKLGMVPATQGLAAILKQYDQMAIVVDEQQQVATVMTKAVAGERGLKPFPLPGL